jgi:glycosyltransferase involved in cell wall biosynthesis
MKVLFNHQLPFSLAHGGTQIQIEQTTAALQKIGVTVEMLRWWDGEQTGDILQSFGRVPTHMLRLAHKKGMRVILSELLTEQGSRSSTHRTVHKWLVKVLRRTLPASVKASFSWDSYKLADACLALTPWEARLMEELFEAPPEKMHVIPNGVEEVFLNSKPAVRGPWLICTATITERKRVLELSEAAVLAQTPVWIIGKSYSDTDGYGQRFLALAREQPALVRFEGPVTDRQRLAQIYREARGFVLLSTMESLSLSALEAAACECPLLLSDLPWARTSFGSQASYCPIVPPDRTAPHLKRFSEAAPKLEPPPRPLSWVEVAQKMKALYERLLSTSR